MEEKVPHKDEEERLQREGLQLPQGDEEKGQEREDDPLEIISSEVSLAVQSPFFFFCIWNGEKQSRFGVDVKELIFWFVMRFTLFRF